MTRDLIGEAAQKKHAALLAGLESHLLDGADGDPVLVCDAAAALPVARRGERVVRLEAGERAAALNAAPRVLHLAYDRREIAAARPALVAALTAPGLPIAADPQTRALLVLATRLAASDIPVLVQGPTGTGKEVLARFLHARSARRAGPFVAVNCAAMPEAMLESLLFGHRRGAFTGASEAHEGFFRAADGGTLLLDEIGEMPLPLQAKLLRALQEGEVVPIGATTPIKVDVRIVACTNRDLAREIAAGRFREDLFYRLNVFPLALPALRERPGDLAALAFGMLLRHGCRADAAHWIAPAALARLATHTWPGNVRELENVMRRAILLAGQDSTIAAGHIVFDAAASSLAEPGEPRSRPIDAAISNMDAGLGDSLSDMTFRSESEAILRALEDCAGHRREAARRLGISERTLRYRLSSMREAGLLVAGARA